MSLGYSFVDGAFEGQAIQLETTQMRIPKSDLKTAIFYAKPNNGDTFYHIVLSKGENYIEGKSTISVAVFGMGGKEEVVPEWISDVAVMDEYAILFNPGYTIDELVLTSEAPTNDQVKYWHESRVPFYDQAELNHHFSLIEQTQDEIRSFVSWREVVEGTLGDYESRISHLVWFSNENQSFITNAEGAVTSQTVVTSEIVTYSGRNRVAGTINSVVLRDSSGSTMSGGSITYSNPTASNSGSVTWTIPSGTNLLKDSGFLDVTITVEDVSYSKKLYWNKAKTGQKGADGATGVGIDSVVEYYLATSASSGVTTDTSGWSTTIQTITPDKKYLWNYETVNYTDETSKNTTPVIIGVYGDKGGDGSDGSPGRGIGAITNYYLASDSSSGVTREVGDWTTSVQNVTASKRYLWNYEKIDYVNPTGVDYTQPAIIGVYGDKGEKGDKGIDAKLVDISSSHNFFIGEDIDKVRVYTPSAIILTPNFQNCAYNKWQYSINGTTFSDVTSGSNGLSINETTKALSIASTSSLYSPTQLSITFKCLSATGEFDLITISRIYDSESLITRVIDTETEIIQTNEQINSKVRKSLLTTAITTITEDLSGRVTSIQITPLKTTLSEGTRVVIVDSDSINSYVATVSREVLVGSTILPLDAVTLIAKKESTVHIEQAYQTSQIKQTADSILQEVSKYNSNKAQVTPGGATLYRFNKDLKSTDGKSEAVIV
jgi:hypothetical protein